MKFQATVVLDFKASSIAEAGEKLGELLHHAEHNGGMKIDSVQLGTPPPTDSVTLPSSLPVPQRAPDPRPDPPRYSPPVASGGAVTRLS